MAAQHVERALRLAATLLLLVAAAWSIDAVPAAADALPIEPGSWTLAILPDTQNYTQFYPQHFYNQTQWIRDHVASHNIKYVFQEGDVTQNNVTAEWNVAKAAMDTLNGYAPYAISAGNHDDGPGGLSGVRTTLFNDPAYFGPGSYYATQPSIGGFYEPGKTVNSYHTFSVGLEDWLVLELEWGPSNGVVDWANQVVAAHPFHKAILVTHAYMYDDETIYDWAARGTSQFANPHWSPFFIPPPPETVNDGQELWDKLVSQHDNFRFVFSGHALGDGTGYRSSLTDGGSVVHQLLANYQMKREGGQGDMRLLEFKADGWTVEVRTYSPSLDRYDTMFDQQFTLDMYQLRGPLEPPPPPLITHAVAANLIVSGPTNPATNTVGAIQIPQASAPGLAITLSNRGDYQFSIGGTSLMYYQGILLASITEHDRPDFVGRRASVEIGRNSFIASTSISGLLALSLMEAGNPDDNEVNFNTSVAWFQFQAGWQGAHMNAGGTVAPAASNRVDSSMVSRAAPGRYTIDLGVNSRTDGLLFATGNNNDNVVVQTGPFADGSAWDVRIQDNATNFAATGKDRDFSFLFLPYNTPGLIGGYYDGLANSHISSVGDFTMSRLGSGQYELTVTGETPQTGMLIMNVARLASVSGVTAPDDNILTYQPSPSGSFLINSYDLPGLGFQDTAFAWAFISFANPITPPPFTSGPKLGDYNLDTFVDIHDYELWKEQYGSVGLSLAADGNKDGVVDAADYVIWRRYASSAPASGSAIPEPATLVLAMWTAACWGWRRQRHVRPTFEGFFHVDVTLHFLRTDLR